MPAATADWNRIIADLILLLIGRSFIAEEIAVQQFLDADPSSDSRGSGVPPVSPVSPVLLSKNKSPSHLLRSPLSGAPKNESPEDLRSILPDLRSEKKRRIPVRKEN